MGGAWGSGAERNTGASGRTTRSWPLSESVVRGKQKPAVDAEECARGACKGQEGQKGKASIA